MKGLLHSKKFKTNLKKWLFMYVGVMGLLTTVITYSKYITSLYTDDEARVTKFDITTERMSCNEFDPNCIDSIYLSNSENEVKPLTKYRPTSTIPFYFKVTAKELETNAKLILTFGTNIKFELISIDEIDSDGQVVNPIYLKGQNITSDKYEIISVDNTSEDGSFSQSTGVTNLQKSIKRDTIMASETSSYYKVTVKYICAETTPGSNICDFTEDKDDNFQSDLVEIDDTVQVGYSAIQKTN